MLLAPGLDPVGERLSFGCVDALLRQLILLSSKPDTTLGQLEASVNVPILTVFVEYGDLLLWWKQHH